MSPKFYFTIKFQKTVKSETAKIHTLCIFQIKFAKFYEDDFGIFALNFYQLNF